MTTSPRGPNTHSKPNPSRQCPRPAAFEVLDALPFLRSLSTELVQLGESLEAIPSQLECLIAENATLANKVRDLSAGQAESPGDDSIEQSGGKHGRFRSMAETIGSAAKDAHQPCDAPAILQQYALDWHPPGTNTQEADTPNADTRRTAVALWPLFSSEESTATSEEAVTLRMRMSGMASATAASTAQKIKSNLAAIRRDHKTAASGVLGDLSYVSPLRPYMVHPNSWMRVCWDLLAGLTIMYDTLFIPLNSFDLSSFAGALDGIDLTVTLYWSISFFAAFFVGFETEGRVEMDPAKIWRHYLATWFIPDLIACSIDWVLVGIGRGSAATRSWRIGRAVRAIRVLRLVKLVRVFKLGGYFTKFLDHIRSAWVIFFIRVGSNLFSILLMAHYLGSYWYLVGTMEISNDSWVKKAGIENAGPGSAYVVSIHWALVQSSFGSTDIFPTNEVEALYANACSCFWLLTFAMSVCFMTLWLLQTMDASKDRMTMATLIRQYFKLHEVPSRVRSDVLRFHRMQHDERVRRLHETDIPFLKELPVDLRMKIHKEVYTPFLMWHPLFRCMRQWKPAVIDRICHLAMGERHLEGGEALFQEGAQAEETFVLASGVLDYFHMDGDTEFLTQVEIGDVICEAALWGQWTHVGQCTAVMASELIVLNTLIILSIIEEIEKNVGKMEPLKIYARSFIDATCRESTPNDLGLPSEVLIDLSTEAFEGELCDASVPILKRGLTRFAAVQTFSRSFTRFLIGAPPPRSSVVSYKPG